MVSQIMPFDLFIDLSVALTGFTRLDLLGTGVAQEYYDEVVGIVGEDICGYLWAASARAIEPEGRDSDELEKAIRETILSDPKLGPVARNIIKMWYLGSWERLPETWRGTYGDNVKGEDHVVSGHAYKEGLVWVAMEAHPMGAKQPGYGTWSLPPGKDTP